MCPQRVSVSIIWKMALPWNIWYFDLPRQQIETKLIYDIASKIVEVTFLN